MVAGLGLVACGSSGKGHSGRTSGGATPPGSPAAPASSSASTTAGLADVGLFLNLGDSIASGVNVPSGLAYRDLLFANDAGHPAYDRRDLATRAAGLALRDDAVPGLTSQEVLDRARALSASWPEPPGTRSVLVSVSMGGNDLLRDVGTNAGLLSAGWARSKGAALRANWEALIGLLRARFAGRRVVIVGQTLYDLTDGTGQLPPGLTGFGCADFYQAIALAGGALPAQNLELVNEATRGALRDEGALLADTWRRFQGHGIASRDPYLSGRDCIHPNEEGHHQIRRAIWEALTGEP